MEFTIYANRNQTDQMVFIYDNEKNELRQKESGFVYFDPEIHEHLKPATVFSKTNPLSKSRDVEILKIQFGLACNYTCSYCSQRFVERADETSKKDVEVFMKRLENLNFDENNGLRIEFWGGEPLVYIKTIMPMVEALKEKFASWKKKPVFTMITNGSLLTDELCDWLYDNRFQVSISHDGPGQHVRGPDPFVDPEKKDIVMRFYRRMIPEGRISFNSMLNARNTSRKEISEWFVNFTNDPRVPVGEGSLIDAYDTDGLINCLTTKEEHFSFRRQAFTDIYADPSKINFGLIFNKIDGFTRGLLSHRPADMLTQKCSMDDEHTIAVDLKGNVVTCQNVSAVATAMNGLPHMAGNITNMDAVKIRTGTHWRNRPDCSNCPVVHLCQGACLYLEDEYWDKSCKNAYSDNVALFALSIHKITGYIPYFIEAAHLPLERQDIWGTVLQHQEDAQIEETTAKIVQEKVVVNDVEVYTHATVVT
jgi:uncharacterized protein